MTQPTAKSFTRREWMTYFRVMDGTPAWDAASEVASSPHPGLDEPLTWSDWDADSEA